MPICVYILEGVAVQNETLMSEGRGRHVLPTSIKASLVKTLLTNRFIRVGLAFPFFLRGCRIEDV
jgi:hypothetical protein